MIFPLLAMHALVGSRHRLLPHWHEIGRSLPMLAEEDIEPIGNGFTPGPGAPTIFETTGFADSGGASAFFPATPYPPALGSGNMTANKGTYVANRSTEDKLHV